MPTFNVQRVAQSPKSGTTTGHARHASKSKVSVTPSQAEFIGFINFTGVKALSQSLRLVHDIALYHSAVPFDDTEKNALYDIKLLWESLESLSDDG